MKREEAIRRIEALYPPDAELPAKREIGVGLMVSAILASMDWRDLPEPVLHRLAELCERKERASVPPWLRWLQDQATEEEQGRESER